MNQAIVTGASGFLGRNLAKKLNSLGWRVSGIGHGDWDEAEQARWGLADWREGDITVDSLRSLKVKYPYIFHCAGSGSVGFSLENPLEDFHRSAGTCIAALEFARTESSTRGFIYPSSASIYGESEKNVQTVGDTPCPVSPYGVHKWMSEELCKYYANVFGINVGVVRFFSLYGEGLRKQLVWDATKKIAAGNKNFSGTGNEVRDWLHIDDAVSLMIAVAEKKTPGFTVVNGGTGTGTAVKEIVELICNNLQANDCLPIDFDGRVRAGDPARYVANISGARELGWRPLVDVRTGISRTVKSILGNS